MHNSYQLQSAKIVAISWQTNNIKLFRLRFEKKVLGYSLKIKPGQFMELSLPGFGEAPFAPCNVPDSEYIELCVRSTGRLTEKLHTLKVGDRVGLRGPYGNGWPVMANNKLPMVKQNLLIVVGGLGLVPLRTLILGKEKFLGKETKVQIFYGARHPDDMLFRHEYNLWKKSNIEIELTVDKECANWKGCIGLVTELFDKREIVQNSIAFLCGPPVMYRPVLEKLLAKKFEEDEIFLSLERRMHCGVGVCQHCAVGPYYTCKHGPIFSWTQLKNIPNSI